MIKKQQILKYLRKGPATAREVAINVYMSVSEVARRRASLYLNNMRREGLVKHAGVKMQVVERNEMLWEVKSA